MFALKVVKTNPNPKKFIVSYIQQMYTCEREDLLNALDGALQVVVRLLDGLELPLNAGRGQAETPFDIFQFDFLQQSSNL